MKDKRKTKAQLIEELAALRQQFANLGTFESDHRRTGKVLQAAKDYAETLIDSSLDMIISVDVKRRIIEFNRAAEQTFGYSREEVLGQPVDLLYADPSEGLQVNSKTFQDGVFNGEVRNKRKNGEVFYSYVSASVMRDANGELVGFMGTSRDITNRKALERQRAEFLTMLTHDIRKPLGAILACAEMVLEDVKKRGLAQEQDLLERLRRNALTINSLVTNYLDFSKIEAGHLTLAKRPLKISDILSQVGEQYETEAKRKRITLEFQHQQEALVVDGDPLALERVFANLIHNALKFTPELGRVTVSCRREQGAVVVAVADNGSGIAPKEIPFLFDKYSRASAANHREGTGLGLFIVKALVEAHGGRVEVKSTLGSGSCFLVFLPIANAGQ